MQSCSGAGLVDCVADGVPQPSRALYEESTRPEPTPDLKTYDTFGHMVAGVSGVACEINETRLVLDAIYFDLDHVNVLVNPRGVQCHPRPATTAHSESGVEGGCCCAWQPRGQQLILSTFHRGSSKTARCPPC